MARAAPKPPPATAEETTANGRAARTTTASASISTVRPSIIDVSSVPSLKSHQGVDAERLEAEDLGVLLIGNVVDPGEELERREQASLGDDLVDTAHVDPVVPGIAGKAGGLELARNDVGLGVESERRQGSPVDAEVEDIVRHPPQLGVVGEILGVDVRIVPGQAELVEQVHGGGELHALALGLADVHRLEHTADEDKLDQVVEGAVEVGRPQPDPILPQRLIHSDLPARAVL